MVFLLKSFFKLQKQPVYFFNLDMTSQEAILSALLSFTVHTYFSVMKNKQSFQ